MPPIIKVQDLKKVYHMGNEKIIALNHINLEIEKGEICCLFGSSGSGKSTLLNMLAGLEKPTKGSIVIKRHHIEHMNEKELADFRQKYIGFVFQSYHLIPTLTAIENVALPLVFQGVGSKERQQRAREMLEAVGLKKRLKHLPKEMSGGQQQRVSIARAFVNQPQILFADEPTGNLDTHTTKEVMEIMMQMAAQYHQTLVIVSHDLDIAKYATKIITVQDGQILKIQKNNEGGQEIVYERKEK